MVRHLEVESTHYMFGVYTGPVSIQSLFLCFTLLTWYGTKSCVEHPALLAGCVCNFSKEVKPVLVLGDLFPGDLLHELHDCTSFRDDTHFHQQVFT